MADVSRESDQQEIDSAINKLAERKNDVGSEIPSSSIPQKRPSPNSNDHQFSTKRVTSSQIKSFESPKNAKTVPAAHAADEDKTDDNSTSDTYNSITEDISLLEDDASVENTFASCSQDESLSEQKEADPVKTNKKLATNCESICVNPSLTTKPFMDDFNTKWFATEKTKDAHKFNDDRVKLYKSPFKICVISEFLANNSFAKQIVDEMSQMEWHRKQMDLYEFHQTTDLANLPPNAKPTLNKFYNMLVNDMLPWMKQITGLPLTRISASCSMYNYGDYLLVHDDLLSDRQIAFVYYLSPWCEEWTEAMGGALELFESDTNNLNHQPKYPIVQKFCPRNNQFVFFRVCKESFHQVGEVTNLVYPRLTINGWFHGPGKIEHENSIISTTIESSSELIDSDLDTSNIEYHPPVCDELDLNEWINPCYLRKRVKTGIQQHIEEKSEASLEMFLITEFSDLLLSEFRDNAGLNWVLEGPANQRKYETIRFTPQSTGPLKDLYTLFTSESMFNLLHEYTELDLHGANARNPTCSIQLCRFTQGCYTLLGDSSTFADSALDVILFFNVRDGVGKVTYLSPSQGENEYSVTGETDATASSMDISTMDASDISTSSAKHTSNLSKLPKNAKQKPQNEHQKSRSDSSNTSKCVDDTSEEEASVDDLSISNCSKRIFKNLERINSASTQRKVEATVHENNDSDNYDIESIASDIGSDAEYDELAQEAALLTIHPKNNSLNLVYRLSGQAKFVKYISKNSLKADEYVYILFASYKE